MYKRQHKAFIEIESNIKGRINYGVYSHAVLSIAGSSLFPSPEREEIKRSHGIAQESSLIPWLRWKLHPQHEFSLYLFLNKKINLEQNEFSTQSYDFGGTDPFTSIAIGHSGSFMNGRLTSYSELYRFRYLSNDYWNDHVSLGVYGKLNFRWHQLISSSVSISAYQDNYIYNQIKTGSCTFGESSLSDTNSVTCPREDTGYWFLGGLSFTPSRQEAISAYFAAKNHSNSNLKVYDEERFEVFVQYSLAFPSLEKSSKYLRYFEDSLSRREAF